MRQAGVNRSNGKLDFELSPAQPLFVDGKGQAAVLQQSGAGIVPVPYAEYVHRVTNAALDTFKRTDT